MEFSLTHVLLALLISAVVFFGYVASNINYWRYKNLPFLKSDLFFGEIGGILTSNTYTGIRNKNAFNKIKAMGWVHGGVHFSVFAIYIPVTPNLVKRILLQDFDHFTDKGFYYNEKDDPISANLFSLGGESWKYVRTILSPSFTAGKIKILFDAIVGCSYQMQEAVETFCNHEGFVEAKEISARYTIDNIGSCVYGLDCNSLKNSKSQFAIQGRKIFESSPPTRILKIALASLLPQLARFFGITLFPQETRSFFLNIVRDTIKFRKENCIVRKDVLQSLIKLHDQEENGKRFTVEQVSAQAFIFFAAGFETSSTTLSFCLYELSIDKDIQERARDEIITVLKKHNGKFDYNAVMDMKYLDQVIDETLRKYPPVSFMTRVCSKDYKVPDTDVIIPKGMFVVISILGLHKDPEYFPDPEKFDPERFSPANKQNIIPYTYLPFGEGPRMCIGLKFGLLQVKVGLISLLSRYTFSLNSKTQEPLIMEPFAFTMYSKNGIYLNGEKLVNNISMT